MSDGAALVVMTSVARRGRRALHMRWPTIAGGGGATMFSMSPPPVYAPMLAAAGPIHGHEDDYGFEPKWDGWRAVVSVHDDGVEVRTRTGRVVSQAVPELAALADQLEDRSVVLDGELVAHAGTPASFYRLGRRMAARHPAPRSTVPLTLVVFDLLWLDGDVTAHPYRERRALLDGLRLVGPAWCISPSYPGSGADLFAACTRLGLEGIVAKRLDGRYYPGERRNVWVKAKCSAWVARHARHRHAPRR